MPSHGLPVIVSMTTIRSRLATLGGVIESLRSQSLRPDRLILNISRTPYLLDEGIDAGDLPAPVRRMAASGALEVYDVENTGSYRKLLPTLARYGHADCLIATCDDDAIYPPGWLAGLCETAAGEPVIAAYRCRAMPVRQGALAPYGDWPTMLGQAIDFGDVLPAARDLLMCPIGRGGILYRPGFFRQPELLRALREAAPAQDDLAFRFATLAAGIRVRKAAFEKAGGTHWHFAEAARPGPSLFDRINRDGGNDAVIDRLLQLCERSSPFRLAQLLAPAPAAAGVAGRT